MSETPRRLSVESVAGLFGLSAADVATAAVERQRKRDTRAAMLRNVRAWQRHVREQLAQRHHPEQRQQAQEQDR
jgi:hypothetical protein